MNTAMLIILSLTSDHQGSNPDLVTDIMVSYNCNGDHISWLDKKSVCQICATSIMEKTLFLVVLFLCLLLKADNGRVCLCWLLFSSQPLLPLSPTVLSVKGWMSCLVASNLVASCLWVGLYLRKIIDSLLLFILNVPSYCYLGRTSLSISGSQLRLSLMLEDIWSLLTLQRSLAVLPQLLTCWLHIFDHNSLSLWCSWKPCDDTIVYTFAVLSQCSNYEVVCLCVYTPIHTGMFLAGGGLFSQNVLACLSW